MDPLNLAPPYASRGIARFELGDKKGAITDFNQALRINPNLAPAYTGWGVAHYTLGDKQGAIADLQKAPDLNLEPDFSRHLENLTSISLS
ncbi:tetratricopeptide repeat protein [Nostoc sp. FACHB-133]|uniref:tetratricopeptide repeat protein n=1 Tax=Nostoc sp. FACHB-133 TaxID=2692835 RepID=UPI0016826780|nr:tetratricopeptide repeat protein [Nostoc sp. FACHB-133]MBD2524594.1 tetratricopeptide repeat protein [Nostoc sp. FACHB-133]